MFNYPLSIVILTDSWKREMYSRFPDCCSLKLWCRTSRSKKRTGEIVVSIVHYAIPIGVHPPASTNIARIPRSELGQESGRPTGLQQLKRTMWRQRIGRNNGVIKKALARTWIVENNATSIITQSIPEIIIFLFILILLNRLLL
jgi:hypothetical protein